MKVQDLNKQSGRPAAVSELSNGRPGRRDPGRHGAQGGRKDHRLQPPLRGLKPDSGTVIFKDRDIADLPTVTRCRQGIGRTCRIPRPLEKMAVFENLLAGTVHGGGLSRKKARPAALEVLDLIKLAPLKDRSAGGLPLLDRKRLEPGRALATLPG